MILLDDFAEAVSLLSPTSVGVKYLIPLGLAFTLATYVSFAVKARSSGAPRNWASITRHAANLIALVGLQIGVVLFALQAELSTNAAFREMNLLLSSVRLSFAQSSVCGQRQMDTEGIVAAETDLRSADVLWPGDPGQPMQPLSTSAAIPCDRLPVYNFAPKMREIARKRASAQRLLIAGGIAAVSVWIALSLSTGLQMRRRRSASTDEGDGAPQRFRAKW